MTDTLLQRAPILPTIVPIIAVGQLDDDRPTEEQLAAVEAFARGEFPGTIEKAHIMAGALQAGIEDALKRSTLVLTAKQRARLNMLAVVCTAVGATFSRSDLERTAIVVREFHEAFPA